MHSIYIYHLDIYWYICRISCGTTGCTEGPGKALRAHRLPVTQMGGIPIHALRMMSFLAYLMLKAKKRLSTGLWRVWNNRNAVAFHRLIDSYLACLCLC